MEGQPYGWTSLSGCGLYHGNSAYDGMAIDGAGACCNSVIIMSAKGSLNNALVLSL